MAIEGRGPGGSLAGRRDQGPDDGEDVRWLTVRDVMTLANGQLLAAGDAGYPASIMATWIGTPEPAP